MQDTVSPAHLALRLQGQAVFTIQIARAEPVSLGLVKANVVAKIIVETWNTATLSATTMREFYSAPALQIHFCWQTSDRVAKLGEFGQAVHAILVTVIPINMTVFLMALLSTVDPCVTRRPIAI